MAMKNPTIDHACNTSRQLDEHLQRIMYKSRPLSNGDVDDLREWVDSIRVEAYEAGIRDGKAGKMRC